MSIQAFFLRTFLFLRKAGTDWTAPVEKWRTRMEWSDRFVKLPKEVAVKPELVEGIPVEWIIPPNASSQPVIFYIHGGGFTWGWYNLERRVVAHICQTAACRALAVDYRLAPEHPFPAGLEDCLTAYYWLLKNGTSPRDIVIAGFSAGGNLTLATLISLRDAGDPLPAAAVCISPLTDLECTGESFLTKQDPALSDKLVLTNARHYAGNQDLRLPLLSPHYGDLRGLPPLLIQVGDNEILFSDATRLADNARAAGVDVSLGIWPRMWHGWHLFAPTLPEAQQAINAIGDFIRQRILSAKNIKETKAMNTTENPANEQPDRANLPRWMVLLIALFFWVILLPLVTGGIPWAISLLTPRYGWIDGRPTTWNLLGLVPVALATICLIWLMILHFSRMPKRVQLERTPRYLLRSGPYRFTRNPMYVAELTLWFGWAIFYGNIIIFILLLVMAPVMIKRVVAREERDLEARFGEAYREYKNRVPRWFGKVRR